MMANLARYIELLPTASLASFSAFTLLSSIVLYLLYRAFFSQIATIPGPLICRFTSIWIWYHTYIGDDCTVINGLHKIYGPVVRIGPNDCVISDGTALASIYTEKGGFVKADCYTNFDFEGHATIFSAIDADHRARRSKAVVPLFSMNAIRAKQTVLDDCVQKFITRTREEAKTGRPVNLLTLSRRLALEALCTYLFEKPYGSFEEKSGEFSAGIFVDVAVAFGRFFFLPNWLFLAMETTRAKYFASKQEMDSNAKVDEYAQDLIRDATTEDNSYQGRLKTTGISDHEIEVQCKDLIFAGTDSSGTILATICWWLCREPKIYARLKAEVNEADARDPSGSYNPQSLKYLDAVIREGLRISRAQPARFPRKVPTGGWAFTSSSGKTFFFPEGTIVGCAPLTLHFNPEVFPDPDAFRPERWRDGCTPEMQRDLIPFNIGARQCIARNLASFDLVLALRAVAREDLLKGAKAVGDEISVIEWFNGRVQDGRIDISWS